MKLLLLITSIVAIAARPAVDVEKTVLQVQSILQANAQLPRLTRQEILELLNDIRAEDAKSTSTSSEQTSTEKSTTTTPSSTENEINPVPTTPTPDFKDNLVPDERESYVLAAGPTKTTVESTTKAQPTLTVVLPYTPRDGSSLQELYTRPPRTEVVALPKTTPKPNPKVLKNKKLEQTLKNNHDLALENIQDFPAELQAFLDSHGIKSSSGNDHFLLPLDGFKPLPPAKIVDGTVQLPENILLSYDLISPSTEFNSSATTRNQALSNYLYEPLLPEPLFELDTSESQKVDLPLDMPKTRKTKSSNSDPLPLLEPFDYDSIKVIPLGQGPSPVEDTKTVLGSEQSKRQANSTEDAEAPTTAATDLKNDSGVSDNAASSADTDSGASISDLEESFGGAAPEKPGDSELPPPRKNGFYWMADWNSFLEVGDGDTKVNIRFEPKLGDPQMFLPVSVP
ncbi:rho GTPase-activating protein gacJ-like [Cydia amplana]|uniref:rho GTPase-activating protein gacJ-like n=1 Tax=Cydia amplana TaxID=1869771 RepID=UPI002FE56163